MTEPAQLISSLCPYCGVGCGLYLMVQDGVVRGLEYQNVHPVNQGSLCPKGNACLELIYHNERLLYPLKRVNDHFEQTSWDEALSLVAVNLAQIQSKYGPDRIGFLASAKCSNEENYLLQKLARLFGTNNIDHCARL
jgi:predicted molibdopterin-dependent oxidoreductase YjgC